MEEYQEYDWWSWAYWCEAMFHDGDMNTMDATWSFIMANQVGV